MYAVEMAAKEIITHNSITKQKKQESVVHPVNSTITAFQE